MMELIARALLYQIRTINGSKPIMLLVRPEVKGIQPIVVLRLDANARFVLSTHRNNYGHDNVNVLVPPAKK